MKKLFKIILGQLLWSASSAVSWTEQWLVLRLWSLLYRATKITLMMSLFPAGRRTGWNLEPWRPSQPLRLPPPPAWSPSLCDSNPGKWSNSWYSRIVLFSRPPIITLLYLWLHVCVFVFGWHLLPGSCKVDTPSTLRTSFLCEWDS